MINITRRHSILGSILGSLALTIEPTVTRANDDKRGHPESIFARHPRHKDLDCHYPAFRTGDGGEDSEVWYIDSFGCKTAQEAKNLSSALLSMSPCPFYRTTLFKATGSVTNIVDYVTVPPEKWPLPLDAF